MVPTKLELDRLVAHAPRITDGCVIELCGFGPIASAARASALLNHLHPKRCLLLGIAGTYDNELCAIGNAYTFATVGCFGIGALENDALLLPSQMGFAQWQDQNIRIHESLPLDCSAFSGNAGQLLTVCAAAGKPDDIVQRTSVFPNAVAEDMEGFGVAVACQMAGVSLSIVRGISNIAGDRNTKNWEFDAATSALTPFIEQWLGNSLT